jgi:hypothetical protein
MNLLFSLSKNDFKVLSGKSCRLLGKILMHHLMEEVPEVGISAVPTER